MEWLFLGLGAWLNVFLRANLLYFSYVISKKFLKLENISFWVARSGPKWLFCEKNMVLRNANFWNLFWNKKLLWFVSYCPAWSFDDRKIINKVLGDIFYKHIHCISGSGFWNPIFDMIWHCVVEYSLVEFSLVWLCLIWLVSVFRLCWVFRVWFGLVLLYCSGI